MLPADLSGLCFFEWYYLPLAEILRELKCNDKRVQQKLEQFKDVDCGL